MADGEPTDMTRYVTEGEVLVPVGQLRFRISVDPAVIARADATVALLRDRLRGTVMRRIVLPSDERATIIDQE